MSAQNEAASATAFRLPSNSGRNVLEGNILRAIEVDLEPCLLLQFRSRGTWLRRDDFRLQDEVEDYDLRLPQVIVSRAGVDLLLGTLRSWLNDSLMEFNVDRGLGDAATLTVEVGHRHDYLCTPGKPAFTLIYAVGSIRFEVAFLVDHSCLLEWSEGLERAVAAIGS